VTENAVLLDTCALIWRANGDSMHDLAMARIVAAALSNALFVSPVSAWEIGLLSKLRTGRSIAFWPDSQIWFARAISGAGIKLAEMTPRIAIASSWLPGDIHNDPADRLLIATARDLGVPLITRDSRIIDYARDGHCQVIAC
jgi:PIN domain nuclease of toxin-antitoxin system